MQLTSIPLNSLWYWWMWFQSLLKTSLPDLHPRTGHGLPASFEICLHSNGSVTWVKHWCHITYSSCSWVATTGWTALVRSSSGNSFGMRAREREIVCHADGQYLYAGSEECGLRRATIAPMVPEFLPGTSVSPNHACTARPPRFRLVARQTLPYTWRTTWFWYIVTIKLHVILFYSRHFAHTQLPRLLYYALCPLYGELQSECPSSFKNVIRTVDVKTCTLNVN